MGPEITRAELFWTIRFGGFGTAVNAIGHQISNPATTDWMNASTFRAAAYRLPDE